MLQLKVTEKENYTLVETQKNDKPTGQINPVQLSDYSDIEFPQIRGEILVISGMPTTATGIIALYYKAYFKVITFYNPREKNAEVAYSINPNIRLGQSVEIEPVE